MTFNSISIPSVLNTILTQLQYSQSQEEYVMVLKQLDEEAKSDSNIAAGYNHLLTRHPNLLNVDSGTVARVLSEYYFPKSLPIPSKLSLDLDSTQNIKMELSKTFHDCNVDYLANSN
jgi:hypothetical protein